MISDVSVEIATSDDEPMLRIGATLHTTSKSNVKFLFKINTTMVAGTRDGTMLMSTQTAPAKQTPTLKQSKIAESMQAAAKLAPPKADGPCWPSERRPAIDAVNEATAPPSQPCETNKGVRHFLELSDEQIRKSVEKFETYHEVLIDLGFTPIKQSWNDKLVRFKTNFTETLIKRCIAGNIPSKHLRYRHYGESQKRQQKDGEETAFHTRPDFARF